MKRKIDHGRNQSQPGWHEARSRTSAELLAILAPTAEEPEPIRRISFWKTGPQVAPERGSAA